jgi:hypothetical protein
LKVKEDALKDQAFSYRELDKEKQALINTNAQIMDDYRNDLETLKNSMKTKDKEDRHLLDSLIDEKKQKEYLYQRSILEINDLKEECKKLREENRILK